MSSEKEYTGIWRIISIPPRIFDWVLDHKLLTFLAVGAVFWGCGEVQSALRSRAREQKRIEALAKAEQQKIIQAEREKQQRKCAKELEKISFRNMPSGPVIQSPTPEELKKAAEQKRFEDQAVSNAIKYAFSSKPKLKPQPVNLNQLDPGAKR